MTRTVNSSFSGIAPFDVDVDAPMLTNTLKETLEDLNLIHDMVTCEYSTPANKCEHIGNGKGAKLLVPICNQPIAAPLQKLYFNGLTASDAYGDISQVVLWAAPFYVPKGGGDIVVSVDLDGSAIDSYFVTVYRDDGTEFETYSYSAGFNQPWPQTAEDYPFRFSDSGDDNRWYIARIYCWTPPGTVSNAQPYGRGGIGTTLNSVNIFYIEQDPQGSQTLIQQTGVNQTPVDVAGTGVAFVENEIPDEMISQNGRSINAKILSSISKNISNLYEYVTGWPNPGNISRVNVDSGDIRPADSRTMAHDRSTFGSEPLIQWPIFCEGFGAVGVLNTATPPDYEYYVPLVDASLTDGSLTWFAPFPTATAEAVIRRTRFYFPNIYQTGSNLVLKILICSTDGDKITNWQAGISLNGGATTYSGSAVTTGISNLTQVTFSSLSPVLDEDNDIVLSIRRTAGVAENWGFIVLGWCMAITY